MLPVFHLFARYVLSKCFELRLKLPFIRFLRRGGEAICSIVCAVGMSAALCSISAAWLAATPVWASANTLLQQSLGADAIALRGAAELPIDAHTAYWLDDRGDATVDQVAAQNPRIQFAPRTPGQKHDIHNKVLWLRFDATTLETDSRWVVEIGQPTLDAATLYWRSSPAAPWVVQRVGDQVPRAHWPMPDRLGAMSLNDTQLGTTTYYLRVTHARVPFSAPLRIYKARQLLVQRELEHFFLGAYFGLIVFVVMLSAAMAWSMRETSFVRYAVYCTALGLAQASFVGIAGQYLWPHSPHWTSTATALWPALAAAASLWFVRSVIQPNTLSGTLNFLTATAIALQCAVALIDAMSPSVVSLVLVNSCALLIAILIYATIWSAWQRGDRQVRWIAVGFLPMLLALTPALLRNFGLISGGFVTQHGVTIASALELPILFYALMQRTAARRESIARIDGLPQTDPLTGAGNLRNLLRSLHGCIARAQRNEHTYGLMLVELHNYDWFVQEHGQEMADRALVLAATRLRLVSRDVDMLARLEGNQFVLLVEGPCHAAEASKTAAQIVSAAQRPSDLLPEGVTLKMQVTAALMPDANEKDLVDNASASLGWLLSAAEYLDEASYKAVRTVNF